MISANLGSVVLASDNQFTLTFSGNNLISFAVDSDSMSAGGVSNSGKIIANGGRILMTAKAASAVLDHAINMTGILQAQSVSEHNGEIILSANKSSGIVRVSGKIDVSGKNANVKGGTVKIAGYKILIDKGSEIDASGVGGGGEILIGGDYQGKAMGTGIANASATVIMSDTLINANAIGTGDGGKVIVWADDLTKFNGLITARGGDQSGNGGLVFYLN